MGTDRAHSEKANDKRQTRTPEMETTGRETHRENQEDEVVNFAGGVKSG